jgi:hypothetical protein
MQEEICPLAIRERPNDGRRGIQNVRLIRYSVIQHNFIANVLHNQMLLPRERFCGGHGPLLWIAAILVLNHTRVNGECSSQSSFVVEHILKPKYDLRRDTRLVNSDKSR